jgi:nucleotide-binding universal stress UspA family protein
MKLILGIDDSPHSRAALEWVRKAAWPAGTRALVVSVVRPLVSAYTEAYAPATPALDEAWNEQLRFHGEITAVAERELRSAGLDTSAKVVQGDPRTALVEAARDEHADLVVVGSHGRTGLAKLIMGSVAAYVVAHAPCSVLVVKLPAGSA